MKRFFKFAVIGLTAIFLFSLPMALLAADDNIVINQEQIVNGNFVKFGNIIEVKGAVNGDVIVAGGNIIIAGPVAGDVIAVGNTIKITGPVMGSVRAVANSIEINGAIDHNVWVMGNAVVIDSEAKVGWDLNVTASSLNLKAPVAGNAWLVGQSINLAGMVEKNVEVNINSEGKLNLAPEARISGDLTYQAKSNDQFTLQSGAVVSGKTERRELVHPAPTDLEKIFGPVFMFLRVISLFSLLVVGLILITVFPKMALQVKEEMFKRPQQSLGWGAVYSIVTPVVIVILMATIIGLPLALITLPLYLILLYLAKVIAGFALGLWLADQLSKGKKYKGNLIWAMVLGLAVVVIVCDLPLIGLLAKIVLVWWALGALINTQKGIFRELR
jgi:cytoskeletal protein CcmA (bactofilin family)